ncbi:Eco57I restriction-modification methylase domain-containing protein [Mycobacterium attenuatum]|uniref:Eco57I restriction-modification methylase domain-containing protein n=1 Tax=Mycobacterium attenuatum TaxID=2341086 RepID=UPI000F14D2B6|nr:hypothetical protein [Mycobacterium attenuatum]VBA61506.1 hypothetical protein LAUMK41_04882 [Mycobacterium attenuatum]
MRLNVDRAVTWNEPSTPAGIKTDKVYVGPDPHGLGGFQVAVANAQTAPSRQAIRDLFMARRGRTPIQLMVAVVHGDKVHLFGPDPQAQPIEVPVEQAARQLQSILSEPDVLAATERCAGLRKASDATGVPGFTNSGLFATHHIMSNVPQRSDWQELGARALPILGKRRRQLIDALGFTSRPGPNGTLLLSVDDHPPRAVAVLLDDTEQFDAKTARFQLSPVAFGLAVASRAELPWLVVLRKDQIRLYPGRDGVGVGSKGQAETYFEIDLSMVDPEHAALLPLIFSATALIVGGTAEDLLRDSARYASELGERLRERIYDKIVPPLAKEVAFRLASNAGVSLDAEGLATAYRVTLRILFRLLFQAYAEDRRLLPSERNEGFDANSLKTNARRLLESDTEDFGDASTIWLDLVQVWNAIDHGNPQWQIPAYNGGLFSTDSERSPDGALIKRIELPDSVLGPALKSLLIDVTEDGVLGLVDFHSLSVREFGTIYEGLLESSLSVAEQDLALNDDHAWVPADGGKVDAPAGSVYFHTASGERKATGSYFTPKVVVDHLIETSIVPALTEHLQKIAGYLSKGDGAAASREFFDFRVVDLAMGSGHFLVAAVDKIEALMRTFLTEHTVAGVTEELLRLAGVAKDALGSDDVARSEVDEVSLLRRQVARRCIYGLDINPMAVELARLALWVHTFVPGLPMSNLDHGLVHANSLTGIGSIDEALDTLQPGRRPGELSLFDSILTDQLASAKTLLIDIANASEANKAEIEEGARLLTEAREAADTARRIFDAATAVRLGTLAPNTVLDEESLLKLLGRPEVEQAHNQLLPAHMPFLFPEVFLRAVPGFDAIIGNPPWDKVRWEAAPFWARVSPGLMALPDTQRDARIEELRAERPVEAAREQAEIAERRRLQDYFRDVFTLRGGTHLELAQLMLERAFKSVRPTGYVGLVLPRQFLVLAGWKRLRENLFGHHSANLVQARNAGGWLFEGVHASYAVVLLTAGPKSGESINVAVVTSAAALRSISAESTIEFTYEELSSYSENLVVPWFNNPRDRIVFDKMRDYPRLSAGGSWIVGTHDARWDFTRTGRDHGLVVTTESAGAWRVMMTRHLDPFSIRNVAAKQFVEDFRALAAKSKGVAIDAHGLPTYESEHPVVLLRYPSRSDDTRTLISSALPAAGFLYNAGYVHAIAHEPGTPEMALVALIGVLNSNTEDWWARRFVDRHVTSKVVNNLPLPALQSDDVIALAERTAVLLRNSGYTSLAGGIDVKAIADNSAFSGEADERLRAGSEAVVARAYGLQAEDLEVIRTDFSEDGFPRAVFDLAREMLATGNTVTAP